MTRSRPSSLSGLCWARPGAAERARRSAARMRVETEIDRAARKLMRDIVKRRARALLRDPGQLEMIAGGLSLMSPSALVIRIRELRRSTRSLRARPDPLVGRVDAHNLNAAELAARLLRRLERREAVPREAA